MKVKKDANRTFQHSPLDIHCWPITM